MNLINTKPLSRTKISKPRLELTAAFLSRGMAVHKLSNASFKAESHALCNDASEGRSAAKGATEDGDNFSCEFSNGVMWA